MSVEKQNPGYEEHSLAVRTLEEAQDMPGARRRIKPITTRYLEQSTERNRMEIRNRQWDKRIATKEIVVTPEEAAQIIAGLATGINQTRFSKHYSHIPGSPRSWAQPRIKMNEFQEVVFKVEDTAGRTISEYERRKKEETAA